MASSTRLRPRPGRLVWFLTGLGLLLMHAPLVTVVFLSFRDQGTWSFRWYEALANNSSIVEALGVSLWVAMFSTLISLVVGTTAAFAIYRANWFGRRLFRVLTYMPLVMPEIVMGLSLLIWFVALRLTLGMVSLVLAHVTFSLSYVIATVGARLAEVDPLYEDAARDLGATPAQVFTRITFPLIRPAILSGGLMAFTLSLDDFLISFFVSGAGTDTLPLKIYSMIKFGVSPEINALSTILLLTTAAVLGMVGFYSKREKA